MTFEERLAALELAGQANQLPASMAVLKRKLEQDWQPDASVLLQPGSILAEMLPYKFVFGIVSPAGAIVAGSGFTAVRNGLGDFTVTFTPAFASVPAVLLSLGKTANVPDIKVKDTIAVTASAVTLITYNSGVALLDAEFHFFAIAPR